MKNQIFLYIPKIALRGVVRFPSNAKQDIRTAVVKLERFKMYKHLDLTKLTPRDCMGRWIKKTDERSTELSRSWQPLQT